MLMALGNACPMRVDRPRCRREWDTQHAFGIGAAPYVCLLRDVETASEEFSLIP
jgi:hypothetical protein